MPGPLILLSLEEAFSNNPSQPRLPKGQKGAGQWSKQGESKNSGHDLWIMFGFSYATTAAAAYLTDAGDGWAKHEDDFGDWEMQVAESMLTDIHRQRVRTTPAYSGHQGAPNFQVGDTYEIPLMAITPHRALAAAYADEPEGGGRSVADWRAEVDRQVRIVTDGAKADGKEIRPEIEASIRQAFQEITGARLQRADHFRPATVYQFLSNKSTPIRSNERVLSGRYKVVGIENKPIPNFTMWSNKNKDFVEGYARTVKFEFVEDLPIVQREN